MSPALIECVRDPQQTWRAFRGSVLVMLVGAASYGAVFGLWRSPAQGLVSAIKMPCLFLSVTVVSVLINTVLAKVETEQLDFAQVVTSMSMALAVAAALLGALSPVVLFFQQLLSSGAAGASQTYCALLLMHVALVGAAGVIGNLRLYRLLRSLTGSALRALRVLIAWVITMAFVGFQLSWYLSPFLARPGEPVPFLNPNAFRMNVYEYLYAAIQQWVRA